MNIVTVETETYKYAELSEKAKDHVLSNLGDINVDFEWWDTFYDGYEDLGIRIAEFNEYRAEIRLLYDAEIVAANIIAAHPKPDTEELKKNPNYKPPEILDTAETFLSAFRALTLDEDGDYNEDEYDESEIDFTYSLSENARIGLRQEYEYLTSEASILNTIKANEYDFTVEGNLF